MLRMAVKSSAAAVMVARPACDGAVVNRSATIAAQRTCGNRPCHAGLNLDRITKLVEHRRSEGGGGSLPRFTSAAANWAKDSKS